MQLAAANVKKFMFELGRTFGVTQYDKEPALKAIAIQVRAGLGGLSLRAAPNAHSQSMGSIGQMQRALCGQLRALLLQIETASGVSVSSESPLFVWSVKHAQWLLNCYLTGSDGQTAYARRWGKDYQGPLHVW